MLRDSLLSAISPAEFAKHADLVYEKKEDPYAAVAALKKMITGE